MIMTILCFLLLLILPVGNVYGELLIHKTFYYQRKLGTSTSDHSTIQRLDWTSVGKSQQHHDPEETWKLDELETTEDAFQRHLISVANEELTIEHFLLSLEDMDSKMSANLKALIAEDLRTLKESHPLIVISLFDVRLCRPYASFKDILKTFLVFRNEHVVEFSSKRVQCHTYQAFRVKYPNCLQKFPKHYSESKELAELTFMNMNSQSISDSFQEIFDSLEPPTIAASILNEKSNDWSISPRIEQLLKTVVDAKKHGWQSKTIGKSIFFGIGKIPLLSYKRSSSESEKKRAMIDQIIYELATKSGLDAFIVPYLYVNERASAGNGSLSAYTSMFSFDTASRKFYPLPKKYVIFGNILYSRTDTGNTYCSLTTLLGLTTKYVPRHSVDEMFFAKEIYNEFIGAEELDDLALFSILFRANGYHSRNFVLTFSGKKNRLVIKNIDYEVSLGSVHHTMSLETYGYRLDDNLLPIHPHFEHPIMYTTKEKWHGSSHNNTMLQKLLKRVPRSRKDAIALVLERLFNIDLGACRTIIKKIYGNLNALARQHVDNLEYIRMKMIELIAYSHSASILRITEIILKTLREAKMLIQGLEEDS